MADTVFQCPKCGTELRCGPATGCHFLPCPKCGAMVVVPETAVAPRRATLFHRLARLVLLIVLCWALTQVFGAKAINPEAASELSRTRRSFQSATMRIRSPLPFVIAYRLDASEIKKGVKTDYTFEKYYLWYAWSVREMNVADPAPALLTWVWF